MADFSLASRHLQPNALDRQNTKRHPLRARTATARAVSLTAPGLTPSFVTTGDAEEYAIYDFEGFGSYLPSETADLELVRAVGAAVREHGTVSWPTLSTSALPAMPKNYCPSKAGLVSSPLVAVATFRSTLKWPSEQRRTRFSSASCC